MTRTVSQILLDALANQQGEIILRVNTWATQAAYDAAPTVPEYVWTALAFDVWATSAAATLVTANDYTVSDFGVFIIERGAVINGVEYTVQSGLYFVRDYREDFGTIMITGSSFPYIKVQINPADGTYQEVIEAFCTAIGKTAVFKNTADAWLGYQFYPDLKPLTLNKAELIENLIKQKYTILMFEESPGQLVFYTLDSNSFENNLWASITWSPELGLFCATSTAGTRRITIATNGADWITQTAAENNGWSSITWSPELGLFCAVATGGTNRVMTSTNGIDWVAQTAIAKAWVSITWSPELGLFCAVAGNNGIMTSANGIDWVARTAAGTNVWTSITWSPELGLFCAVANIGTNKIATSPNGSDWTIQTAAEANAWSSITWSPELGLFCAVATSGTNRVMTSTNGVDWVAQAAAEANNWTSITWSPELGLFCAVAANGTNRVMTSTNGVDWIARTAAEANTWNDITWSPELGLFCAIATAGENRAMTSQNGIDWRKQSLNTDYNLTYEDGPTSYLTRSQSEVHYAWTDEAGAQHNDGDTSLPLWNLGYLESTAAAPATKLDPYYKYFLQKAPVRLDITDGDKIHFSPFWSIDPTQTIDAMAYVSEHFNSKKSPAWYQEIKSIVLFDKTAGA